MGLLHGFTSKRFSKRWTHPSDNRIGFRYRERYNVPFVDLIRKRQFTFYIFLLYSSLRICSMKQNLQIHQIVYCSIICCARCIFRKEKYKDELETDEQINVKLHHKVYKGCLEPTFWRRNPSYGCFIIHTRW